MSQRVSSLVELPSNRELLRYEITLQLCALYYQTIGKERMTTDELNLSGRQGGVYENYIRTDPVQLQKEKVNISPDYTALLYFVILSGQTNNTYKEIVITPHR